MCGVLRMVLILLLLITERLFCYMFAPVYSLVLFSLLKLNSHSLMMLSVITWASLHQFVKVRLGGLPSQYNIRRISLGST